MRLAEFLKNQFDVSLSAPRPKGIREDADEMPLSDMIPYAVHYDDNTVITKDDGLVQVLKIDGLNFESLTAQQIRQFELRRNTALRSIASSDRGIYVHVIRRKMHSYPEGQGQTWFARYFNDAWRARYEKKSFYVNEIYISIVCNPYRQGAPGLIDRIAGLLTGLLTGPFSSAKITRSDLDRFEEQAKGIYEASQVLLDTLAEYGAKRLSIQRVPDSAGPDCSEPAEFFHYLVNLERERVPVTAMPLDTTLAVSRLNFNGISDLMEVQGLAGSRVGAVLSMAEWPARTCSGMLEEFLKLPVEFIITQSFFYTDRIHAEADMKLEKRRITINDQEGIAEEDKEELKQGLQDLSRGRSVNGLHHLTMLVHVAAHHPHGVTQSRHHTIAELDRAVGQLKKAFIGLGVKAVREQFAVESFFWSQLPGQAQHFIARRGKIKSANFAGFASLHNFATGKIAGNLWGPAIMSFETESRTPYHFNFHREMDGMVAGHTAITADTGSGKTTLLSALIAMADKAAPRVFWFDNRHGAKVFMAAMGGVHCALSVLGQSGWNPFRLPDTPENRLYLVELLTLMRTCYGAKISPEDIRIFKKTVDENYLFADPADRRLRNLSWCFGTGTELERDMAIWHGGNGVPGANWGVFDNEEDQFDLTRCRHYCFEMQQLIKDGNARPELPVVLSYPFHRIEQAMNGQPFILVLEEGQNLVKHAWWREKIDAYIMQIRRKNGILVFVTPDAKYLYCETDSIQKQTVTKIYLPNDKYVREEFVDRLHNTEHEYQFLIDNVKSRKFMIKRGSESVRAQFDLSDMPEFIPVLSSNDKGVALMEHITAELGTCDPEQWVPEFMRRSLHENTHNLAT